MIQQSYRRKKDRTPRGVFLALLVGIVLITIVSALMLYVFDPSARAREEKLLASLGRDVEYIGNEFLKDVQLLEEVDYNKLFQETEKMAQEELLHVEEEIKRDVAYVEEEIKREVDFVKRGVREYFEHGVLHEHIDPLGMEIMPERAQQLGQTLRTPPPPPPPVAYSVKKVADTPANIVVSNNNLRSWNTDANAAPVPVSSATPTTTTTTETMPTLSTLEEKIHELFKIGSTDPAKLRALLAKYDHLSTAHGPDQFLCPAASQQQYLSLARPCPPPDAKNAAYFRVADKEANDANINYTFIFYQHLRKAGGTGFCELAKSNLPARMVPPYFCMPDNKGSLATPPWSNSTYLTSHMKNHKFKLASNEWDAFYSTFFNIPGAVFATTFRDPVDRWYSQYRFEHLERRDGSAPDSKRMSMLQFYNSMKGWTMGENYYIKTFDGTIDPVPSKNSGDFYWTYHKYNNKQITWEMFQSALNNLKKFDLILITEWLDYAVSSKTIESTLGWHVPPKHVLPHESQAVRESKVSKASKDLMPPEDYEKIANDNALDFLFFEVAKRIFLERSVCGVCG